MIVNLILTRSHRFTNTVKYKNTLLGAVMAVQKFRMVHKSWEKYFCLQRVQNLQAFIFNYHGFDQSLLFSTMDTTTETTTGSTTIATTTTTMLTAHQYNDSKYDDHEEFADKCCLANRNKIRIELVSK